VALHLAIYQGREAIATLLIAHGANVDALNEVIPVQCSQSVCQLQRTDNPDGQKQWTPLYLACLRGDEAIAALLIQTGANVDTPNEVIHLLALRYSPVTSSAC
jgi:ankyrin repeat protein